MESIYIISGELLDKLAKDLQEMATSKGNAGILLCAGAVFALHRLGFSCGLDRGESRSDFRGVEIAGTFYEINAKPPSDTEKE